MVGSLTHEYFRGGRLQHLETCVRVDRPLASVDAGKGARFLRALLYAHMIAMQRTHPRPIAVAPKITAVESGAPEAPTASPTSGSAVGGPGDGARGDASSGEGAPSGKKTAQARSVRGVSTTSTTTPASARSAVAWAALGGGRELGCERRGHRLAIYRMHRPHRCCDLDAALIASRTFV